MKFVRAIWKLLVGIKDALVLVFMLLFFGLMYAALSARPAPVKDGVLALDLNGSVVEQPAKVAFSEIAGGNRIRQYRLRDLVAALDHARTDSRVKAVALDLDGFTGGGQTAMSDLSDAIRGVRAAGKPVIAYAVGYTNDSYQLASAASEVWLNPLGAVLVAGPGGSNLYYKGLLEACRRRAIPVCAQAAVQTITGHDGAWELRTARGSVRAAQVVIALGLIFSYSALLGIFVLLGLAASIAMLVAGIQTLQGKSPKLLLYLSYASIAIQLLSLIFFYEVNPDARVASLGPPIGKVDYPPVRAADYLAEKLSAITIG